MSELREDLDRALGAVNISPPPVERVLRDGRRLRIRRRAAVVAGAIAVAAVVAGYPALSHSVASPPGPATSRTHDPVITDSPGAASGDIALGKIGKLPWKVSLVPATYKGADPGDVCFKGAVGTAVDESCGGGGPRLTLGSNPAAFGSEGDSFDETTLGIVAANVTYLILTFTDGQQLKLIPVTYAGYRYVAWGSALSVPIKNVTAHLGGPHSDSGQTESAIPFGPPDQIPQFTTSWYKPGQALPPAVSEGVGSGTVDGQPWSATVYLGAWGTCFVMDSFQYLYCTQHSSRSTTVFGESGTQKLTVYALSVAPGVASLRLSFSDGSTIDAKPVTVGNERFVARAVPRNVTLSTWTTYDAAGQRLASGTGRVDPG